LLGLSRSAYYDTSGGESELNLLLMRLIDAAYTAHPFLGYRKITRLLRQEGYAVNKKRIARLMAVMGLQAMVPGPNTSRPHPQNPVYPYRLRGVPITTVNQVWSCDITYIPMPKGFVYLFAILDWYSRFVLNWQLSNTLDTAFCCEGLEHALKGGKPLIFNSDQGVQFTSKEFTGRLLAAEVTISMDGRGRAFDNIFIERLWRTVKYEDVYLKGYETPHQVQSGLRDYFHFYNEARPHQALDYQTPAQVYRQALGC
jgi:putative transposase